MTVFIVFLIHFKERAAAVPPAEGVRANEIPQPFVHQICRAVRGRGGGRAISNGIFEVFFYYREHKAALIRIQHEQAEAAAAKICQSSRKSKASWAGTADCPGWQGSIEQRRFDALRLLRQVPAVTELAQVDFDLQGADTGVPHRHQYREQRN